MVGAARLVRPFPVGQRQRLMVPAPGRTQTAAWVPAVGNDQLGTVSPGFVFDLQADHANAHVATGPGELAPDQHPVAV